MRSFQRAALAACMLSLAFMAGGCTTMANLQSAVSAVAGFTVTQDQIDAVKVGFKGFEKGAADYGSWPACKAGQTFPSVACHSKSGLVQLKTIKDSIYSSIKTVDEDMKAGDTQGVKLAYDAASSALANGKNILASFGLGSGV